MKKIKIICNIIKTHPYICVNKAIKTDMKKSFKESYHTMAEALDRIDEVENSGNYKRASLSAKNYGGGVREFNVTIYKK